MVCSFIGMQAQIDIDKHGGRNPMVDLAQSLDILGERSEEEKELDRIRGPVVADRIEDDPRFSKVAADPAKGVEASNAAGSFEAFIAMMGGGTSPAAPGIGQQVNGDGADSELRRNRGGPVILRFSDYLECRPFL